MIETINKHKVVLGFLVASLIGWGGLTQKVASSQEKDKEQDKKISAIEVEQNSQEKVDLRLSIEQKHFNEQVRELKEGQREIIRLIRDKRDGLK